MSRKLMAVLVSGVLLFGSVSTSALSAPALSGAAQNVLASESPAPQVAAAANQSPLAPGGAAGIKEAQGSGQISPWAAAAIVAGIFIVAVLLMDNDDDDDDSGPPTTGTN